MYRIEEFNQSYLEEWLDFFDTRAFKENQFWKSCYCTFYHKPKDKITNEEEIKTNRDYAIYLINSNQMKGYIALNEENKIIGWCNVNEKRKFQKLLLEYGKEIDSSIISIVCFIMEKEYRNIGISKAMINRIVADMKKKGFSIIEAYPSKRAKLDSSNYHGRYSTYLNYGFKEVRVGNKMVMRFSLK